MKIIRVICLLLAIGLSVHGQAVNVTANKLKGSATAPSGACTAQQVQLTTAGVVWTCQSGTWGSAGGSSGLTVGTTTITGGTSGRVLYNNAGVVGEYTVTGTAGSVVLSAGPTLTGTTALASATLSGTLVQTNNSGTIAAFGRQGTTNPAFAIVTAGATDATGISVTSAAAGSGVTIAATSSGSNESLNLAAKGTGTIVLNSALVTNATSAIYTASGATTVARYFNLANTTGSLYFGVDNSTGTGLWTGGLAYASSFGTGTNTALQFATNNNVRATFDGSGLLGIGTTAPSGAQVIIESQSTTRPSLKLNMPSGTSGTQEAFGVYNNGTLTFAIPTDGSFIYLGGATASFPALKRSSTTLQVRLGNDSSFAALSAGDITTSGNVIFSAKSILSSPSNSVLTLYNNNADNFDRLQFGGTTSSFPALKRSSAELQVRLADDSAYTNIAANNLTYAGTPQTLTGAGAVNLTTYSTLLVTTAADALTLAAGAEGQYKFIRMKTDGGDGTLTVTNLQGGTTITFNDAGDFVLLFYQDAKWHVIVNSGCVVA